MRRHGKWKRSILSCSFKRQWRKSTSSLFHLRYSCSCVEALQRVIFMRNVERFNFSDKVVSI
uniref:Uncharacterized protein n=1 Tax=Parascaris equorum TaxID=6256 RepID=A0A914RKV7_PAREQ